MKKAMLRNGLILGGFALITTSLIALTFSFTHERIDAAKERQLLSTLNQVVDQSLHDNRLHLDCILVNSAALLGNKPQRVFRSRLGVNNTALIVETTAPDGYSGAINLVVAVDQLSTVLGARVVQHKETPGLGDKIELRVSDWILDFTGVRYEEALDHRWQVKKDGGQFDQFTGATITPRAVVNAVKNAAIYAQNNMQQLFSMPSNCAALSPDATTNAAAIEVISSE